jgi:5S rRNA maturation endonuclease (ribonuclease M5)
MNLLTPNSDAANGSALPLNIEEIAGILGLKPETVNGKIEYHGPNPFDPSGASKDGFMVFADNGMAYDRNGEKYTTKQVQAKARELSFSPVSLPVNGAPKVAPSMFPWGRATVYEYHDERSGLLYQVGRVTEPEGKRFSQRCPKPGGGWIHSLKGVRRVLWLLPDVINAQIVFICEGEKAADALNQELKAANCYGDHVATTNSQGALKWQDEFCEALNGKAVIVLPDNDDKGREHATQVCASIKARGKAQSLKQFDLPNLPPKGDAADFFSSGGSLSALLDLANAAPEWKPEERTSRLRFLTFDQVMDQEPPDWLVPGLLVEGGTSLLTAKQASFKSFFALDLALCVATGKEWHGRKVKQGTVIYIVAEGSSGMRKRQQAWREHFGVKPEGKEYLVVNEAIMLAEGGKLDEFISEVRELEPVLIVVDTLARCAIGLDENSAKDTGLFIHALDRLSKVTGAHILTVHHNNKDGGYRGSTALPAAVDTHISLERKGDQVTLKVEKQKDADEGPNLFFTKLEVAESLVFQYKGVADVEQVKAGLTANQKKVYDVLLSSGCEGATYSQWKEGAAEVGITPDAFKKIKSRLRDDGEAILLSGTEGENGAKFIAKGAKVRVKPA